MCLVQFGSFNENDATHGIRAGKIKLTGWALYNVWSSALLICAARLEMASFFEPALEAAVKAIKQQIEESRYPISVCHRFIDRLFSFINMPPVLS